MKSETTLESRNTVDRFYPNTCLNLPDTTTRRRYPGGLPDNSVHEFGRCFVITINTIRRATQPPQRFKTHRCPKSKRQYSSPPLRLPLVEPSDEHIWETTVKPTGLTRIYRSACDFTKWLTIKRDSNRRPTVRA